MAKTTVRDPQGNSVDATLIDITESIEHFNKLTLSDGTVLNVKIVVTKVCRLDDRYDNEGNPIYMISSNNVVVIHSAPDILKKGAGKNDPTRH